MSQLFSSSLARIRPASATLTGAIGGSSKPKGLPRCNSSRDPQHTSWLSSKSHRLHSKTSPPMGRPSDRGNYDTSVTEPLDGNSPGRSSQLETQYSRLTTLIAICLAATVVCVAVTALATGFSISDLLGSLEQAIQDSGPVGPLLFVAVYIVASVVLVPASVLTLAAGYLFGTLPGTGLVSIASTSAAAISFLISRYAARPFVASKLAQYPKFQRIETEIAAKGAYIVFLLRLTPLVPFGLLNYALGPTPVGFKEYVLASWLGMLPGTLAYVYLGATGRAATAGGLGWIKVLLYGVGVIAALGATTVISRIAKKALGEVDAEQATAEDSTREV